MTPEMLSEMTYVTTRASAPGETCDVHYVKTDADVAEVVLSMMYTRRHGGRVSVCKTCVDRSKNEELRRLWEGEGQVPLGSFGGDEGGWVSDT